MSETFRCPNCHGVVSFEAKACPHCGSDDRTGWSSNTMYDGLDLPGWDDSVRDLGFRDTLLWRDLKLLVGFLVILSFVALSLRMYAW